MPAMGDLPKTREERLAAKLRENLRRRKTQARELGTADTPGLPNPPERS
jgi:tRNA A37 threonylcarbamoyladenosine dehydratase